MPVGVRPRATIATHSLVAEAGASALAKASKRVGVATTWP